MDMTAKQLMAGEALKQIRQEIVRIVDGIDNELMEKFLRENDSKLDPLLVGEMMSLMFEGKDQQIEIAKNNSKVYHQMATALLFFMDKNADSNTDVGALIAAFAEFRAQLIWAAYDLLSKDSAPV